MVAEFLHPLSPSARSALDTGPAWESCPQFCGRGSPNRFCLVFKTEAGDSTKDHTVEGKCLLFYDFSSKNKIKMKSAPRRGHKEDPRLPHFASPHRLAPFSSLRTPESSVGPLERLRVTSSFGESWSQRALDLRDARGRGTHTCSVRIHRTPRTGDHTGLGMQNPQHYGSI